MTDHRAGHRRFAAAARSASLESNIEKEEENA